MLQRLTHQPPAHPCRGGAPATHPVYGARRRAGLTLLEVIVSMAIFMVSLIAIWQLVSLGTDRALDVSQVSRASALCQSKLAELECGAAPLLSSGYAPLDTGDPHEQEANWQWRCEASEGAAAGLWQVKVWIRVERPGGRAVEVHLAKMILDPTVRGSSADAAAAAAAAAANMSNSSSSSPSGSTDSSGTTGGATTPAASTPAATTPAASGATTGGKR